MSLVRRLVNYCSAAQVTCLRKVWVSMPFMTSGEWHWYSIRRFKNKCCQQDNIQRFWASSTINTLIAQNLTLIQTKKKVSKQVKSIMWVLTIYYNRNVSLNVVRNECWSTAATLPFQVDRLFLVINKRLNPLITYMSRQIWRRWCHNLLP